MIAPAKAAAKREVLLRSVWRRFDPSGTSMIVEVTCFSNNIYGQKCCKGKTPGGRLITLDLVAMQNGDPRFEHVHDNYVEKASA